MVVPHLHVNITVVSGTIVMALHSLHRASNCIAAPRLLVNIMAICDLK